MPKVTMYSKDYCPYCQRAKHILKSRGYDLTIIDVESDQAQLQKMMELSRRRTVPQIFFDDKHIGGHDDLVQHLMTQDAA